MRRATSGRSSSWWRIHQKARKILGWKPRYDSVETILDTAWQWHKAHPKGYQ